MKPTVSVLMPAFNPLENYPTKMFIDNVNQTMSADDSGLVELCIANDGSSKASSVLIKAVASIYRDQIRVINRKFNNGVADALSDAARIASGKYIIVQSIRSWYAPGAIRDMAKALDDHPEIDFVYGNTRYHGASNAYHCPGEYQAKKFFRTFDSLFGYMYRRKALDAGWQYETYINREDRNIDVSDYDFLMGLICLHHYQGLWINRETLQYYYTGEGQMTNLVHKYQKDIDQIFSKRWMKYYEQFQF